MIIRGTFKGKPLSVVAGRVIALQSNDNEGTAVIVDIESKDGGGAVVHFDEPLEVVEGALCEALQYARRDRN